MATADPHATEKAVAALEAAKIFEVAATDVGTCCANIIDLGRRLDALRRPGAGLSELVAYRRALASCSADHELRPMLKAVGHWAVALSEHLTLATADIAVVETAVRDAEAGQGVCSVVYAWSERTPTAGGASHSRWVSSCLGAMLWARLAQLRDPQMLSSTELVNIMLEATTAAAPASASGGTRALSTGTGDTTVYADHEPAHRPHTAPGDARGGTGSTTNTFADSAVTAAGEPDTGRADGPSRRALLGALSTLNALSRM